MTDIHGNTSPSVDGILSTTSLVHITATDLEIEDCNIKLCSENKTTDSMSSSVFTEYNSSGVKFSGLGRYNSDNGDGSYYIFKDAESEPSGSTDFSALTRADFNCGTLDVNGQITATSLRTATIDSKAGETTISNNTTIIGDLTLGGDLTFSAAADATIQSTLTYDMIIGNNTVSASDNASTRYYDSGTTITTSKNMILFATDSGGVVFTDPNGSLSSNTIKTHVESTSNPHSVTATQVSLGNVTDESKATMFTDPTFTNTTTLTDLSVGGNLVSNIIQNPQAVELKTTITGSNTIRGLLPLYDSYLMTFEYKTNTQIARMYRISDTTATEINSVDLTISGSGAMEFPSFSYPYVVGSSNKFGVIVYDVRDPANFNHVSAWNSTLNNTDYTACCMAGRYLYVCDDTNSKLLVFDISTDMVEVADITIVNYTDSAGEMVYHLGRIYISNAGNTSQMAISIIDVQDPLVPINAEQVNFGATSNKNTYKMVFENGKLWASFNDSVSQISRYDLSFQNLDAGSDYLTTAEVALGYKTSEEDSGVLSGASGNAKDMALLGDYIFCFSNAGADGFDIFDKFSMTTALISTTGTQCLKGAVSGRNIYIINQSSNNIEIHRWGYAQANVLNTGSVISTTGYFQDASIANKLDVPFISGGSLLMSDNSTFDGNLQVNGDLQLSGSASVVGFSDKQISIASSNLTTDSDTIGVYGTYYSSGIKYSGLLRESGADWWLFEESSIEPVDGTNPSSLTVARLHTCVPFGHFYTATPAETTLTTGTAVKLAGTTSGDSTCLFTTATNNRLTYTGVYTTQFKIEASISFKLASGTSKQFRFYVSRNDDTFASKSTLVNHDLTSGSSYMSVSVSTIYGLAQNQYLELWAENITDSVNITCDTMSMTCVAMD